MERCNVCMRKSYPASRRVSRYEVQDTKWSPGICGSWRHTKQRLRGQHTRGWHARKPPSDRQVAFSVSEGLWITAGSLERPAAKATTAWCPFFNRTGYFCLLRGRNFVAATIPCIHIYSVDVSCDSGPPLSGTVGRARNKCSIVHGWLAA